MLSPAPHTTHRSLHVLRASLCEQYGKMRRRYRITKQLYFKGVCLGLHQAVKEIDALLDDGPTVLAKDRDWADHLENHGRMNGSDPDLGTDGARKPMVGAWGQLIGFIWPPFVAAALFGSVFTRSKQ